MEFALKKMSTDYMGLAWNFHVSPDSCNNPSHYENFLRLSALSEQAAGRGVTHVLLELNDTQPCEIIGFVTLRATSLVETCNDHSYVKPALEIAELAVDQEYERQGFGSMLVDFSIYIASHLNEKFIGIQNVVLCADPQAVEFYAKPEIGFGRLEDFYEVLHDGWNDDCTPMYIKLPSD